MVKRDLTLKITRLSEESARYSGKVKVAGIAKQKHPRGVSKKGKRVARRMAKRRCKQRLTLRSVIVTHVIPGKDFLIAFNLPNEEGNYSLTGPAAPSGDKIKASSSGGLKVSIKVKDNGRKYTYQVACLKAARFKTMP